MARPREFDEAEVLRAARDQFWSTGYAGTSMDAIAAATGLGKGSLYGAFGDKHRLFMRVFDAYCADIAEGVAAELHGPDEQALERLSAHVRAMALGAASEAGRRGCLLAKGTAELAGRDPEVTARSLRTLDAVEAMLASDIQAAQRHGDIDPGADPRQLAALLLTVLRGLEALGKAGKDEASLTSIAEAALATLHRPATPPALAPRRPASGRRAAKSTGPSGHRAQLGPPAAAPPGPCRTKSETVPQKRPCTISQNCTTRGAPQACAPVATASPARDQDRCCDPRRPAGRG